MLVRKPWSGVEKLNTNPHNASLIGSLRQRTLDLGGGHPLTDLESIEPTGKAVPAVVFAPLVLPHWEAPLAECRMLFIKRSASLRKHAGQVGFPGGVVEAGDATLLDAGFREAEEEVALRRSSVEVLSPLPIAEVPSGFQRHPYRVATDQRDFLIQESEVESLHLVSMTDLLSCPFRVEHKEWQSRLWRVVFFDLEDLCVWGVTGRIVEHLLQSFFDWSPPEAKP